MVRIRVKDTQPGNYPHGVETRRIYDHQNALAEYLTLPGEKLLGHKSPDNVFFYVLEGNGIIKIGKEEKEVEKDNIIHSPTGIVHCWYNEIDTLLRVRTVKTPLLKEKTSFL
jgi:quercetin dioxygenase-like cupin family protein